MDEMQSPNNAEPDDAPPRPPRYPFLFWRSLSFKMTAATALVLALALGGAFSYLIWYETKLEYVEVARYTERVAELVLDSFDRLADVQSGRPYHTRYLAQKLLDLPQLYNMRVVAIDGTIQFSRYPKEIGTPLALTRREPCNQCHADRGVIDSIHTYTALTGEALYHLPFPIPNQPQCVRCHKPEYKTLGTLVVETEVESVQQKIGKHQTSMALTVLFALFVSLTGTTLLFRRFVKLPLGHLQHEMHRVEQGDFKIGPAWPSQDEIHGVYESFISMTRRLEEVQADLNDMLERKSARLDDLTQELRKIYANLIKMEHLSAVGTLSSQVVHEIRTPLNALNLNLQLLNRRLKKHFDLEPEAAELAVNIGREVERIAAILDKFLDRARRPLSAPSHESLRELAMGVVALMEWEAKKAGATIHLDLDPGDERVRLQGDEMRQILINLVSNAIHALPNGGNIYISARPNGAFHELTVRDDGEGIDEATLEKIFSPFFTTRSSGTGLGLAIVKRMVEEMGGEIKVDSRPQEGTTFVVRLPRGEDKERNASP
ncbi:MAG: sensor histidine kinase [Myxococcales bacterium]|nr:MAG: sensor histidine kinase [Myxococcales bacterium]